MTERTASQRGRSNRRRGGDFERDLAGFLRGAGFPHAERCRDNGFGTAERSGADAYDVQGTPGLLWDCKATPDAAASLCRRWLAKAARDADERGLVPIVVNKRRGHADVAEGWAWVRLADALALWNGHLEDRTFVQDGPAGLPRWDGDEVVRFEVGELVRLLRAGGYGEPLEADPWAA